jgi:hypothetical protein
LGLLDGDAEEPSSKLRRYIITGIAFVALLGGGVAYLLRFHTEKKTVVTFMDVLASGDLQRAYHVWNPNPGYSFQDFLADWGPTGEYGPVKSYRLETAQLPKNGSGVVVVVELSRFSPFPSARDSDKSRNNKEVYLWVERSTQKLSFAPTLNLSP